MNTTKLIFLFVILSASVIFSQQSGGLKIYTSFKVVNDFAFEGDNIWAATTGGAFKFSPSDSSYTRFTKINNFTGVNITAACIDKYGTAWFGGSNGSIDFVLSGSSDAGSVPDIANTENSSKQINSLEPAGDTIIAAHDFGISLIDPNKKVLFDTYFKFGNLTSNTIVRYAVKYDRIYAAHSAGVIIQKQGATNLSAPESWDVYTTANGLPSNSVNKIQLYKGEIYVATTFGLAKFNGTGFINVDPSLSNRNINDIYAAGDILYVLGDNRVLMQYDGSSVSGLYTYPTDISKIEFHGDNIYASGSEGIFKGASDSAPLIVPNGPKANQFLDITFNQSGTLWVASGSDRSGIGFYGLSNETWTNYNKAVDPWLPSNSYFSNYTSPDNAVYFGNWGSGFLRIKDNNITVFNRDRTGMKGINTDTNYVVVTSFANDSKNNLWALNFGAADKKNLTMMKNDSTFYHFAVPTISNFYSNEEYNLVIDQYDTKWFSLNMESNKYIVYFNENGTIDNTSDDKSGIVSGFFGPESITSLAVDKRGDIWIGTSLGAYIMTNTGNIFNSNPRVSTSSIFTLRQQTINCIYVDPINQKWVGTNEGLFLTNSDGTTILNNLTGKEEAFTTKNSPLLSNIIRSITMDESTGRIYVATDEGIASWNTPSIKPVDAFAGLFMYPNPFKITPASNTLTIDGLVKESQIKILTITGKLVKEFSSPGGRTAYWDGKDDSGNQVSSGIYIVVAFDAEGNSVATGKIAVLRE